MIKFAGTSPLRVSGGSRPEKADSDLLHCQIWRGLTSKMVC
jgi:hypothetical protein